MAKANIEPGLPVHIVLISFVFVVMILVLPTVGILLSKNTFSDNQQIGVIVTVLGGISGLIFGFSFRSF